MRRSNTPLADDEGGATHSVAPTNDAEVIALPTTPDETPCVVQMTPTQFYEWELWKQAQPDSLSRTEYANTMRTERVRRQVRAALDDEERAPFLIERKRRTLEEFIAEPQQTPILSDVLAPEMNLLGGPPGQGKSLLARDWAMSVASGTPWQGHNVPEARNVLWIASEGLHDTSIRFGTQPLYQRAKDRIWIEESINLTTAADVEWLLAEYADLRPGLIVFDVIYGMGMVDDNGTKDALPVIGAMKRLSAEWGAATLALGHPPHSGGRRFRGTSMWRDLAYTEWHMADGLLTCEKSKISDAQRHRAAYVPEYPAIKWLDRAEARNRDDEHRLLIDLDVETHPGDSIRTRAARLMDALDMGESTARKFIAKHLGT